MRTRLKIWVLLAGIILGVCLVAEYTLAEEGKPLLKKEGKIYKERPPGWDEGRKTGWGNADIPPGLTKKDKIERLKKLRAENPEKFREIIAKRKALLKDRLLKLKKTDPEKFKEIMRRRRHSRRKRLEHLRKNNPERFRKIVQKRREILRGRLETLKENNPEKYRRIMKRRRERLNQLQHKNPVKYKRFLERRPGIGKEVLRQGVKHPKATKKAIDNHRPGGGNKGKPAVGRTKRGGGRRR